MCTYMMYVPKKYTVHHVMYIGAAASSHMRVRRVRLCVHLLKKGY